MAAAPEPPLDELLWTVALARLLLGPEVRLPERLGLDWAGLVSRLPQCPWPAWCCV